MSSTCNLKCLGSLIRGSLRPLWTVVCQPPPSMGFPRQGYWRRLPFPFPGDLPGPGSGPRALGLPHCRQTLYHLSHQGSLTQHIILLLYMFPTSGWCMCHRCTTNIACMGVFCNYKRLHILCHRLFILRITSPFKNHST